MARSITAIMTHDMLLKHSPSPLVVVIAVDGVEKLRLSIDEASELLDQLGACRWSTDEPSQQ